MNETEISDGTGRIIGFFSSSAHKVLDNGYVNVTAVLGDDLAVVNAARVSYEKASVMFDDRDQRLLDFLIREGHTSPFRHAAITFEIYAPLMVARQWWKYAVASTHIDDLNGWNESSRRYVTEDEVFYIPEKWRGKPENSKQGSGDLPEDVNEKLWTNLLRSHQDQGKNLYMSALREGIAPEQARLFLPAYGMYVRWQWTASLQAVLNFLDQRLEHDAQWEIQQYAIAVDSLTEQYFPRVHEAWRKG